MRKDKKVYIFIFMFFLIVFFMFLPLLLSYIQEKNLIGKFEISSVDMEKDSNKLDMSIEDNLELISNHGDKRNNIIFINRSAMINKRISLNSAPKEIIDEIKKIIDLGIIAPIDLKDNFYITDFLLTSYIDSNNMGRQVKVWDLVISNEEYSIYITMDTKTKVIYSFGLSKGYLNNTSLEINTEKYAEYLGINWEEAWGDKEGPLRYKVENKEIHYNYYKGKEEVMMQLAKKY